MRSSTLEILANAIEKARVDFNTQIKFLEGYELDKILPSTATSGEDAKQTAFDKKYEIAEHGFALAEIIYHGSKDSKW